ncbi:MAG: hypothetical protein WAV38_22435 [Xanthobacteraceae bacterium]
MPFKPSTLIDTIDAIGKVAADAARAADALDHHMRREQRALCCVRRWKASAIPFDCTTERWSDATRDHLARGELIARQCRARRSAAKLLIKD